jgi:hypothetical protein
LAIDWQHLIRILLTIVLSVLSISALLGYFYISFGGFYRNREKRWWIGILAFSLPAIALFSGLLIWTLWNPLVSVMFWYLFGFSLFVSYILYQSITSPYKAADWWIEFSKWLQKRKSR